MKSGHSGHDREGAESRAGIAGMADVRYANSVVESMASETGEDSSSGSAYDDDVARSSAV